jgi:hypothetical protein
MPLRNKFRRNISRRRALGGSGPNNEEEPVVEEETVIEVPVEEAPVEPPGTPHSLVPVNAMIPPNFNLRGQVHNAAGGRQRTRRHKSRRHRSCRHKSRRHKK